MFKFMKNKKIPKFYKDKGDAVFITILLSLMFIISLSGLVLDLGKNTVLKTNLQSIAQSSSQTAVKNINAKGSLDVNSYMAFVNEYNNKANILRAECTIDVKEGNKVLYSGEAPYFKIALSNERGSKNAFTNKTYLRGNTAQISSQVEELKEKMQYDDEIYKVLDVEVFDVSNNFMLSMIGMDCQQFDIRVSSIAFGSQEDLESLK